MRSVYVVAGGVSRFRKARQELTFQAMVKEAYDYALHDLGLEPRQAFELIDGTVASYFSDHFTRQLKAASMVQDYLGLCPKPSRRIEGGGATGGLCFQSGWEAVASGRYDVCLIFGFETMSRVSTWKGNEFIALASDTNFDYPVGGFYTGYYAMSVPAAGPRTELHGSTARSAGPSATGSSFPWRGRFTRSPSATTGAKPFSRRRLSS